MRVERFVVKLRGKVFAQASPRHPPNNQFISNGVFEMVKFSSRTLCQLSVACLLAVFLLTTSIPTTTTATPAPQKMTAEEVVAKHLESIGTAEARAATKSHVILGTAIGTFRLGGTGSSEGGSVMASQGNKSLIAIVYGKAEYPYEKMGFDGDTLTVGEIKPGIRSTLAKFFMAHEMPFREGLMAGTLSAAWPLLNMANMTAKLKYAGTKKIEGQKVHVLEYRPKNDTGLKTTLYFDEETFRHVRTEYEQRLTQQMPSEPSVTQAQNEAITKLIEEYSNFKEEKGLMLPHTYKIQLSIEALNRRALQDWVFTLTQFSFDRDLDASQFDVRSAGKKS